MRVAGLWRLSLILCFLFPWGAFADGVVIPATAFQKVQIPDQRALIHFANGQETLVIDTSFKGEGTNFAWIVPFPSLPRVEPATTGLFETLQTLFQPKIVHEVPRVYWWAVVLGAIIVYLGWKWKRGESVLGFLVLLAALLFLGSMLLPALSRGGVGVSGKTVEVVDRKHVGIYETVTLRSPDGEVLFNWLKDNGFDPGAKVAPGIRTYAGEGWYFVASRFRLGAPSTEPASIHPLSFTFKTDRPVYPLRLTGIDNQPCRIDLYVFGPGQANAPHFFVERSGTPVYPREDEPSLWRAPALRIRHALLRSITEGSPSATKLTATLNSERMKEDVYISWAPTKETQRTFYSRRGARDTAANVGVPAAVFSLVLWMASFWATNQGSPRVKAFRRLSLMLLVASLMGWAVIYAFLPKTEVVVSRMPGLRLRQAHDLISLEIESRVQEGSRNPERGELDVEWVRKEIITLLSDGTLGRNATNWLTMEPLREKDSPGNYTLQSTRAGVDYIWYDIEGKPNRVPLAGTKGDK
jgi:hypothetical protein